MTGPAENTIFRDVVLRPLNSRDESLLYHSLQPPRSVKVSSAPEASIRRFDGKALVYDVDVGPDRIMRHYSFPGRWFRVNCNLDSRARPVSVQGPIPWAFDCTICTPQWVDGRNVFSIHLFTQVLVSRRGRLYYVKDVDLLDEAAAKGYVTDPELDGARGGLKDLVGLLESGQFTGFLSGIYPLGVPIASAGQGAMRAKG